MGRIMAVDYGRARSGIAVTDTLKIVATPLTTVESSRLEAFLADYFDREEVEAVIVGLPVNLDGRPSDSQRYLLPAIGRLRKRFPTMTFEWSDERFTSVLAHRAMIDAGMSKSKRREKGQTDMLSACIILNDYLRRRQ